MKLVKSIIQPINIIVIKLSDEIKAQCIKNILQNAFTLMYQLNKSPAENSVIYSVRVI